MRSTSAVPEPFREAAAKMTPCERPAPIGGAMTAGSVFRQVPARLLRTVLRNDQQAAVVPVALAASDHSLVLESNVHDAPVARAHRIQGHDAAGLAHLVRQTPRQLLQGL